MTEPVAEALQALPEGTRLIHIGPHKTGTTALQTALYNARPVLLAHGVRHAGASRNPSQAVRAVVGQSSPYAIGKPPSIRRWQSLAGEIRRAQEPRVVVSCEIFAWADAAAIRRIVDDLDPARVQVAVTLRRLAKVIPSTWQQNVQAGTTASFETWLKTVLTTDPAEPKSSFWTLQRHDELIERWADVVGRDRITAVVVDDRDRGAIMRAFEGLLGLPAATLSDAGDVINRSLTLQEAEAVRAFNVAFAAEQLPRDLHARVMRFGAAQHMKARRPGPQESPVVLPGWAVDRVEAIQREINTNVGAAGIRIIGDLAKLEPDAAKVTGSTPEAPDISPEVAAALAMGVLVASGAARQAVAGRGLFPFAEPAEVARIPTYQLIGSIVGRAWRGSIGRLAGRDRKAGVPDPED